MSGMLSAFNLPSVLDGITSFAAIENLYEESDERLAYLPLIGTILGEKNADDPNLYLIGIDPEEVYAYRVRVLERIDELNELIATKDGEVFRQKNIIVFDNIDSCKQFEKYLASQPKAIQDDIITRYGWFWAPVGYADIAPTLSIFYYSNDTPDAADDDQCHTV